MLSLSPTRLLVEPSPLQPPCFLSLPQQSVGYMLGAIPHRNDPKDPDSTPGGCSHVRRCGQEEGPLVR